MPVEEANLPVFDPHALEHGNEQVRKRVVLIAVEGEVAGVPEAAAREQHRHVRRGVGIGVAEV